VKRISIQIKIGLLMILAVAVLIAIGYLSYLNLSSIVSSISVNVNPDRKLLAIREITMELQKAENSIRMYSVTHDNTDLDPFYGVISNIDDKVERLRTECGDNPVLLKQTDTISSLIEENIYIWNELLYLNQNSQAIEYLKALSAKLDSVSANDQKQEKGILKRVFSRSASNRLNEQTLRSDLDKIEQHDQEIKEKIMLQEAQLAKTSSRIKEQFYDLTAKMEAEVSSIINAKARNAELLAARTYRWLGMFIISGTLLAIVVMFIITRYVRKTNVYQRALQDSKNEAEKLARTKEQFMANMSHEIRTPVTAITGFTEQLMHEPFDEKTTEKLRIIKSSSEHLERIITDILDFSKLQDGKMVLEKTHFSIRQILEEVYIMFAGQAEKKSTHLSYSLEPDTPPVLLGDPFRLKQIIINLVSNSVKFTEGGNVNFAVSCKDKQPQEFIMVLEVTDTGIGIDENKIDLIFEDFIQEEMSTTRKYGGTGLGLSIVRKLVELQNGEIECKSKKNQGTTIRCEIPYLTGDREQLKEEAGFSLTIPEEVRKLNVLVVDDEEYNRMLFRVIFDRWGVRHSEALNGMEALEMLRAERYDLVFMDLRMPGIDGARTTGFIRNELKISDSQLPVICVTAASAGEELNNYRKAGMNALLQKPFTEEKLLSVILSVIRGGEADTETEAEKEETPSAFAPGSIDLQSLYHISGGDKHFIKQMLITFINTTGKGLQDMHEAYLEGNSQRIADLAHKLIPPCRHLGAVRLVNILTDAGKSIRNTGHLADAGKLIDEATMEFENIRHLLDEHIAKIT
jgi:signal transduction histidine kinase/DNA-binding NarL/FixJ family response regulator